MGRYEDLLEKALNSVATEAELEELKGMGGTNLRDQLEAANSKLKENETFIREGKFRNLTEANSIEGLSLSDLESVSTDDLNADLLREKAESKKAARTALIAEAAQSAGFEDTESYEKAMEELMQKNAADKRVLETVGGGIASVSGGTAVPTQPKENWDATLEAYNEAKKAGMTQDKAMGEAAHALMANQSPAKE